MRGLAPAVLLLLVFCQMVQGAVHRFGLFIGCNKGLITERPLQYAEEDAKRMAGTFASNSLYDRERLTLLTGTGPAKAEAAMRSVAEKIKAARAAGAETFLMVYYSGHGSEDALHMQGGSLDRPRLISLFESAGADFRILVVDACQSGALLREKGGSPYQVHEIETRDELDGRGSIIISSSAKGEMAQESEEYDGGIFTHHLLNGLRGAADFNLDHRISVLEAFHYARHGTQSENIYGKKEGQNPGFDINLVGKSDIELFRMEEGRGVVTFRDMPSVPVSIYSASNPRIFSKVFLPGGRETQMRLPSDRYVATFEEGDKVKAARVDLSWREGRTLRPGDFAVYRRSRLWSRGGSGALNLNPHALQLSWGVTEPVAREVHQLTGLRYVFKSYYWKTELGLALGSAGVSNAGFEKSALTGSLSLAYKRSFFRHRLGQFLLGPELSWFQVRQTVTDRRIRDDVRKTTGYVPMFAPSLPAEIEVYLPFDLWLSLTVDSGVFFYEKSGAGSLGIKAFAAPFAGVGYQF